MKRIKLKDKYPIIDWQIKEFLSPKVSILPLFGANEIVKVGDTVKIAQTIATGDSCIHSPISGTVIAIKDNNIPHISTLQTKCIVIENDNKNNWTSLKKCYNFRELPAAALLKQINNSGIVGLGGAGFPTNIKLKKLKKCHTIIINGAECEPSVQCDNALMQEYPREILQGIEILLHITGANKAIIAIEDDKEEAFNSLIMLNNNNKIKLTKIKTFYASGAEKVLIKTLLNIDISANSFATEIGILCQNVATVKAIYDYIIDGIPLINRIITITGDNEKAKNIKVAIGTLLPELISYHASYNIRLNGPMMGIDLKHTNYPVLKTTNAIFNNNKQVQKIIRECIRCGECMHVCPASLMPQQLYWLIKSDNIEQTINYKLLNCIECRLCEIVCGSNIKLVDYFSFAKAKYKNNLLAKKKSELSKQRFEFREYRLQRNKNERDKMMAEKRAKIIKQISKKKW